ncbi:MAG TPA: GreA/GreB family elongation factor [Solirubrobacteraceae bacterium]|nr:GreA/GreB family elongation factor [Solirubrobacteraceae bacterium]
MLTARPPSQPVDDALLTRDGYERLQGELQTLSTVRRAELAARLRDARGDGGNPAENTALTEALDEGTALEERIARLRAWLAAARVARPADDGVAEIGMRVGVRMRDGTVVEYELVGAGEADPARRRISISSPVGAAIDGHRAGETIELDAPGGRVRFELATVEPIEPAARAKAA